MMVESVYLATFWRFEWEIFVILLASPFFFGSNVTVEWEESGSGGSRREMLTKRRKKAFSCNRMTIGRRLGHLLNLFFPLLLRVQSIVEWEKFHVTNSGLKNIFFQLHQRQAAQNISIIVLQFIVVGEVSILKRGDNVVDQHEWKKRKNSVFAEAILAFPFSSAGGENCALLHI